MKNILRTSTVAVLYLLSIPSFSRTKDLDNEEKVMNLVWSLPEVIERASYVEKQSQGKRNLKTMIYQRPSDNQKQYFWIKVGEDNNGVFVSHFNFFVIPASK